MGRIVLYIAVSLDGYIADQNGGVGWLHGQDPDWVGEDSYSEFVKSAGAVVMGWQTYRQVREELSPHEWVYQGLACYVFTHRAAEPAEAGIYFVDCEPQVLVERLRREMTGDIWLCGGAALVRQFAAADLIDQWRIAVAPTLLGQGIRLFDGALRQELRLLGTLEYNGIVELIYERRGQAAL